MKKVSQNGWLEDMPMRSMAWRQVARGKFTGVGLE
jgi:hypothetical protein